ncbi:NCS1 family nucleobase:cation symporter-1 [Caulobacter sp. RHG1]|uniref:NCS1 family nucleobase:cation symporter-1 n=1 Tax=Caulobacter sp. (strain RHG1) TaxID=2545762 RepID=UPI001557CD18|nr:NCS1 family nucleobase:cation symporter-1 [Caulobacter sp. RHG1]NQE62733.1 Cytosine/purine/uracil/thiamine/allantoin permease family protein [Caulobacter sp. RHG1]
MRTPDSDLWNEDLAPTGAAQRTWRWWHFAALWLGMVMCVPAYMLASGLIEQGMSAGQAVVTVLLGNVIVLVPMLLIGHAGARWGVPYAVLARASFGWKGAWVPAVARAIVACGWYGIQTWIGGGALLTLLGVIVGRKLEGAPLPLLGIGVGQLLAFLAFWVIQLLFVTKGLNAVRKLETWTAPIKILICGLMVWWAVSKAGGLGPIFHQPSAFVDGGAKAGQFWSVFAPALTAMVGFWATLALNIPDFTRFAKAQSDQILGQAVGLPLPMGLLALVSVVTTSATVLVFGKAVWDPVQLAGDIGGIAVVVGLLIISLDTVCCNIAANLVGPAYDFSALWPSKVSYRIGGWITAGIGVLIMPWKLLETTQGYIFTWLVGYSALLGPIAGILIVDYWLVRKAQLVVDDLYVREGAYAYRRGWNPAAIIALVLGVLPNLPGFLAAAAPHLFAGVGTFWTGLYTYAWFVGLAIAAAVYGVMMRGRA